jgi:hypothetical protein
MTKKVVVFLTMFVAMIFICLTSNIVAQNEPSVLIGVDTEVSVGDSCELVVQDKLKHRVQFRVNKMKVRVQNRLQKVKAHTQSCFAAFKANRTNRANSRRARFHERVGVFKVNRANRISVLKM